MTIDFQVDIHGLIRLARVERHVRREEHVVLLEIRLRDFQSLNHVARYVVLFHDLLDRCRVNCLALFEQAFDGRFDGRLALSGSQV